MMDNNAARIQSLEKCIPEIQRQIAVLSARVETTLGLVREIRNDQQTTAKQSVDLIVSSAQNVQRWEVYERERAQFEKRLCDVEAVANGNKLALAKILAMGSGGGAVAYLLIELLRSAIEKI